ncbi:helix-turn-helix domain-containing protein [Escherichia coli]
MTRMKPSALSKIPHTLQNVSRNATSLRLQATRKDPTKPKSPYLTTRQACIAALQSPLHTIKVSAGDGITEERKCHSSAEVKYGTPVSHCRTVKDLNSLLEQRTKGRRQSSMTS